MKHSKLVQSKLVPENLGDTLVALIRDNRKKLIYGDHENDYIDIRIHRFLEEQGVLATFGVLLKWIHIDSHYGDPDMLSAEQTSTKNILLMLVSKDVKIPNECSQYLLHNTTEVSNLLRIFQSDQDINKADAAILSNTIKYKSVLSDILSLDERNRDQKLIEKVIQAKQVLWYVNWEFEYWDNVYETETNPNGESKIYLWFGGSKLVNDWFEEAMKEKWLKVKGFCCYKKSINDLLSF